MEISKRTFLVVGAGKSGLAAAQFLARRKAQVYLTDSKPASEMRQIEKIIVKYPNIHCFWSENLDIDIIRPDILVVSPGVPLTIPLIKKAKEQGLEIIGELELAYRIAKSPFVAITGTNGKTTTTALIGQLFTDGHKNILVGGNIGLPLIEEVSELNNLDLIIAEVSSFQLETIKDFKPKIAVILNITPDHLDRHLTMANYLSAKANVFKNQSPEDLLVLNYDDPILRELARKSKAQVIFFSRKHNLEKGVYLAAEQVVLDNGSGPVPICKLNDIYLSGAHNLENAMAAIAVGYLLGLTPDEIKTTLGSFTGVAHRLELVTEYKGVKFINDSKGTNPAAAIKALESFPASIVLIAGGKNKGNDFTSFAHKIKEKVKHLILVGEAASQIKDAVLEQGFTNYQQVDDFDAAVSLAYQLAIPGDIVLLSPGCASWDMFDSFEQRGDLFKELVMGLQKQGV